MVLFCKPRVCGEKLISSKHCLSISGSPPHVRGKDVVCDCAHVPAGITPACAGKSCGIIVYDNWVQDHPRMCGEKGFLATFSCKLLGSPPHVRGKGRFCFHQSMRNRITPACAGKRCNRVCLCCCNQDHPRMCGEKIPLLHFQLAAVGSPPHVRGKD